MQDLRAQGTARDMKLERLLERGKIAMDQG